MVLTEQSVQAHKKMLKSTAGILGIGAQSLLWPLQLEQIFQWAQKKQFDSTECVPLAFPAAEFTKLQWLYDIA